MTPQICNFCKSEQRHIPGENPVAKYCGNCGTELGTMPTTIPQGFNSKGQDDYPWRD